MLFYVNLKGNNYFVTLSPMHQKRHNFFANFDIDTKYETIHSSDSRSTYIDLDHQPESRRGACEEGALVRAVPDACV